MAANRLDAAKAEEPTQNGHAKNGAATAEAKGGGGIKGWIPLIANIVLMPAIAYGITTFVLVPKLQGSKAPAEEHAEEAADSHGGKSESDSHGSSSGSGKHGGGSKGKVQVPLGGKVLVNVAGTAGTRYLIANMTLVGKKADLKGKVEDHDPELRDAAANILSGKTISDLEKPGMRNIIRAELISAFNDVLGKDSVNEIYLTEFAIQ